jgi:regulator of replication initiation timing
MTLEEFKEFLKDPKNAEGFKGIVKEMGYETPEEIEGLKKKNTDLILDKKKMRLEMDDVKKRLDEIDVEEYIELKSKKGKDTDKDVETRLQRDLKKAEDRAKAAEDANGKTSSFLNSVLIKAQLSDAIDANGFDVKHKDLLLSAFSGRAKVEIDDKGHNVIIDNGDTLGVPANEFFKNYAGTDSGKAYLRQATQRGSGSQSFDSGAQGKTIKREAFDNLSPADQMKAIKDGIKPQD